jgi:hypothetical protein
MPQFVARGAGKMLMPYDWAMLGRLLRAEIKERGMSGRVVFFIFSYIPYVVTQYFFNSVFYLLDEIFYRGYHAIDIKSPLFIIGPPRCGTTFFQDL